MKKALGFGLSLLMVSAVVALGSPPTPPGKGTLATIAGSVKDNKGNPLAGALVSLVREGATKVIRETRTAADGSFITTIAPGRYGIRAVAAGFSEVVFSAVEVRASQELIYRFNLEPVGSGKTLPERRKDRDDVKWTLRSAQTRRSIFQAQEGEDETLQAVADAESAVEEAPALDTESEDSGKGGTRGVIESYVASNSPAGPYAGLNFAFARPASEHVEVIFAGQTGIGPNSPERLEATGRFRPNDRHRLGVTAAAAYFGSPIWTNNDQESPAFGQFSMRAIDEWIIRDGVVILLGVDYSKFIGAGGAHAITPRVGFQIDANARTRLRAAYAPGGSEDAIQSVASFEDAEVVFSEPANRPTAFVDGRAVMERSHRLEIGLERMIDDRSSVEATAFYDTTTGRGVGLLSTPISAFSGPAGEPLTSVANQEGAARGIRLVYTRRLSRVWTATAGYSFGRGQRLSPEGFSNPSEIFKNGFFQSAALQLAGSFRTGTQIRTVLRFSPDATVFAIDPFAGRLGVYDPSLSIQVTQDLPRFGLPVRAEAVLDARNLLDTQAATDNGEILTQIGTNRRSLRGGILVRF
jgi:Carboxypeptidase regulatory-like domain